jgi:hypothetical protein
VARGINVDRTACVLGLLSDTHVPHRMASIPKPVLAAFRGVDLILHAGDVDDPAALAALERIAPVYAVRGNVHLQDVSDGGAALPSSQRLRLGRWRIALTHGHRPGLLGFGLRSFDLLVRLVRLRTNGDLNRRLAPRLLRGFPDADVIVFGHSHHAWLERFGGQLLVNPGAVCPTRGEQQTVARMTLMAGAPDVEVEILPIC